jgi:acetyltransferase
MPVVVVKGGATTGGQRAAASHTGSLASDDRVFDGMARQAGMVRATTIEAAFEAAATLATQPLPGGSGVVVLTTAGGWGVVTADAITTHRDLTLTTLPDDLLTAVDAMLPPRWSRNNPVDLAGGETRETIPELLDMVAGHPGVDSVVQLGLGIQGNTAALTRSGPFHPDHGLERIVDFHERQERRYAEAAADASTTHGKPVLVASELAVTQPDNPMVAAVRGTDRLCYPSADRAVAALGHLVRYASWRRARA